MGYVGALPDPSSDITSHRRSAPRFEHRECGDAVGVGSSIRGSSHHRSVIFDPVRCLMEKACLSYLSVQQGARLGISEHPDENRRVFGFNLTEQDKNDIEAVLIHSNGRKMITTIGYFGAEYRSVLFCVDPQTCA